MPRALVARDPAGPRRAGRGVRAGPRRVRRRSRAEGDWPACSIARKPWARGIGAGPCPAPAGVARSGVLASRPGPPAAGVPSRLPGQFSRLVRRLPGRLPGAARRGGRRTAYRRRIQEFLIPHRGLTGGPFHLEPAAEPRRGAGRTTSSASPADVGGFLRRGNDVPPPDPVNRWRPTPSRVAAEAAEGKASGRGCSTSEWRGGCGTRGRTSSCRTGPGSASCAADRLRRDGLRRGRPRPLRAVGFREYFYYLMNIEQYPEFLPKARELAEEYLRLAWEIEPQLRPNPAYEQYGFFAYDPVTFRRPAGEDLRGRAAGRPAYNPATGEGEPLFRTAAQVVERDPPAGAVQPARRLVAGDERQGRPDRRGPVGAVRDLVRRDRQRRPGPEPRQRLHRLAARRRHLPAAVATAGPTPTTRTCGTHRSAAPPTRPRSPSSPRRTSRNCSA